MKLRVATIAIALSAVLAQASDFTGMYAKVDRVVLEPNADKPIRIQIWGVFAVSTPNDANNYFPPERGYMYFELPKSGTDAVLKEWADLRTVAGKGQVLALGTRFGAQRQPRVRKPNEQPLSPDVYQTQTGAVRVRTDTQYAPVKSVVEFK